MAREDIGCCGAYCGTCRANEVCKGCRTGYVNGIRDLQRAKCPVKVCCIGGGYGTCADCGEYGNCTILQGFYAKAGRKYKKYHQATAFIRQKGYDAFLRMAERWTDAQGKYDEK